MNDLRRLRLTLLPLIALFALTGCIAGVAPMVMRNHGPSGQQLAKNSFDPLSVKVGATTRNEALDKLSVINTGLDTPHFFWGRWATSKWGYMFAVGGPEGAAWGDAGRIWGIHNLLVTFDEYGVAQKTQLMDDGLPLWREIIKQSKSMQPIEMSTPISLKYDYFGIYVVTFSANSVEVVRPNGKVKTWTFAPDKILRLSHTLPNDKGNHPSFSCHVLHLREKTPIGQKIIFCADAPDLFATFRYLQRYASADMNWE
jgi:hypothetical protein